jgi:GTP-binding protein HflX
MHAVDVVLREIGAGDIPQIRVYNKIDRLEEPARLDRDADGRATAVWISAQKRLGLELLCGALAERLARLARRARLRVPASAGALRARLYAAQAVRGESTAEDGSIELAVELPDPELLALARTAGVQILEVQQPGAPCALGSSYLQSNAALSAAKLR